MGASARNGPVGHHALALRFPGHALLAVTAGTPRVGFLPQFAVNYNDDGSPGLFHAVTSSLPQVEVEMVKNSGQSVLTMEMTAINSREKSVSSLPGL